MKRFRWISKYAPMYVFINDEWYREKDGKVFTPNLEKRSWESVDETVPFQNKSVFMKTL